MFTLILLIIVFFGVLIAIYVFLIIFYNEKVMSPQYDNIQSLIALARLNITVEDLPIVADRFRSIREYIQIVDRGRYLKEKELISPFNGIRHLRSDFNTKNIDSQLKPARLKGKDRHFFEVPRII